MVLGVRIFCPARNRRKTGYEFSGAVCVRGQSPRHSGYLVHHYLLLSPWIYDCCCLGCQASNNIDFNTTPKSGADS